MTGIEAIDRIITVLGQGALATWRRLIPNPPSDAEYARIRPFIVLCAPRTGSTHLLELLRQHPQIEAWFEVFHEDKATRDRIDGRPARDDEDGARHLFRLFGRGRPAAIQAVGFKLMYHHARERSFASAWEFLAQEPRLLVIDLYREDLLATLVSHRMAERSGVWQAPGRRGRQEDGQVYISAHDAAAYFDKTEALRRAALARFATQPIVSISYERLVTEQAECLKQICDALEVPHFEPESVKRKFEYLPMNQRLANYDSLAASFAHTPYEGFFTTEAGDDS